MNLYQMYSKNTFLIIQVIINKFSIPVNEFLSDELILP